MRAGPHPHRPDANETAVVAGADERMVLRLSRYGCPVDLAAHLWGPIWLLADAKTEDGQWSLTTWQEQNLGKFEIVRSAEELRAAIARALGRLRK
jgi:hypothetical protein